MANPLLKIEAKIHETRAYNLRNKVMYDDNYRGKFVVDFISLVSDHPLKVNQELYKHGCEIRQIFTKLVAINQQQNFTPSPRIIFMKSVPVIAFSYPSDGNWLVVFEVYKDKILHPKLTKEFVLSDDELIAFIIGLGLFWAKVYDENGNEIPY